MSLPGDRTRDRAAFSPLQRSLAGLLRIYQQVISPFLPSACRFYPTCSQYMHDAVLTHGAAQGIWLGLRRLVKCHPFHPGGVDPVPGTKTATHTHLELNERT